MSFQSRLAILLVALAGLYRIAPHPDNVAPITAMALFGGVYFRRSWAILVPFMALFLSDLVLNNVIYRQYFTEFTWITSWTIYAAFAAVLALGYTTLKQVSVVRLLGVSITATFIFFVVTNLGVYFESGMYPRTSTGLVACFSAALPFLRNSLLGDLFFVTILFGAYHWILERNNLLQKA
jgi:hypothetical protein